MLFAFTDVPLSISFDSYKQRGELFAKAVRSQKDKCETSNRTEKTCPNSKNTAKTVKTKVKKGSFLVLYEKK